MLNLSTQINCAQEPKFLFGHIIGKSAVFDKKILGKGQTRRNEKRRLDHEGKNFAFA